MTAAPFIFATLTYLLMLAAFYWHHIRSFHIPVMVLIILFDIGMPFYLASTRDWKHRLIDDGDILSFGVWMHFGLIITLFVLYTIQILTAMKLINSSGEEGTKARNEHRTQAKGILLTRALVIATGAVLFESDTPS